MGTQRTYSPDRREEPFEMRVMNLQVSDEEAREEIFRRAHYYVHLARRTEYEQSTGLEVIKHLRAAIDPAPDMTPQLVLKTMIMQCDATLGRFPYPWSVDEKDAGARRVSFDMADKETAREIEEMKDIDVKIRSDKRMNWSMIRHEVESFGATPSPTAPKPSPPKLTLKLRGRKDGRDTVLAEADDAIPSIESPALRKHEKRKAPSSQAGPDTMTTRAKRPARTQSPSPDPLDIEDPTLLSIGTSILQGVAVRGLAKRDRDAANRALLKKMFSQYEEDVGPAQAITQAPPQEKLFIRIHLNKPKKQAEGAMGPTNGGRAAGMDRVEENALSQEKSLIVKIKIPPGDLAVLRELYPVESAPPAVGGMISRRKEPSGTLPKTTTLPSCNPKTQPEQGIIPNKPTPPPNIDRAEPLSDTLRAHYHLPLNRKTPEYDPATFPPSKRTRPRKNASVARTGVTNPQQPPAPPSLPTSRQEDTHATLHPSQIPTAQNGPMAIPPAGPFPSLAPTYPTAVTPEAAIPLTPEQYLELYNQVTQSRPAPLDIPFLNSFSSDANSLHTPTISMYRGNLGSQTVPHASPYPVIKGNPSQTPALQTPQSQPPPIPQTPQPTSPPQLLPPSPAPSPKKPTPKKPKPTPKPTPNPPTPRKLLRPRTCKGKFRSTRRSSSGSDTIPYRPDPIKPHSKTPAAQNTRRSSPPSLPPLRSASPTDPRFAPAAYLPAFPALRTAEVRRLFGQGVQLAVGNIWEEYFWGVGGEREKGMYDSRTEVLRGFGQEVSDSDEESESDDGSSDMEKEGEGEEEEEEEGKKGDAATTILARSDQDHDDDEDVDTPLTLLSTIRHLRAEMPDLGDNKGRGLARDFRTHIMAGNRWVYDAVEAVKGKYPGLCAEEAVRLVREGWARQERVWRVEDWRKGKGRGRGRGARTRRMVEEDEDEEEGGTETETEEEGEEDDDGEWSDS